MPKKNYYAVVYRGKAIVFNNWPQCEKYLQSNKGHKDIKGFVTKLESEQWIKTHGCGSYSDSKLNIDNKPFRKPKADTAIHREFRKKVMGWFRSLKPEQKREAMTEIDSFFEMWQ